MPRKIDEIIIHCSATPAGRDVTVADIDRWHRERGFDGIGYHYVVDINGIVRPGRPVERAGAHCLGHNARSVGVCYVGGLDAGGRATDTRTTAQRRALSDLVVRLKALYPGATVHSHRDFAAKECPCFDATAEYRDV